MKVIEVHGSVAKLATLNVYMNSNLAKDVLMKAMSLNNLIFYLIPVYLLSQILYCKFHLLIQYSLLLLQDHCKWSLTLLIKPTPWPQIYVLCDLSLLSPAVFVVQVQLCPIKGKKCSALIWWRRRN